MSTGEHLVHAGHHVLHHAMNELKKPSVQKQLQQTATTLSVPVAGAITATVGTTAAAGLATVGGTIATGATSAAGFVGATNVAGALLTTVAAVNPVVLGAVGVGAAVVGVAGLVCWLLDD